MANPLRRGESGGQVSTWAISNDSFTPLNQTSFVNPYGLTLRQTITSSGSVTIPAGITWVYVVMTGGGAGGYFGYGGKGGEVTWGWTVPQTTCVVGAGGANANNGGYTRYGHIIAKGGVTGNATATANYYAIPAGASFGDNNPTNGGIGANAGNGGGAASGTSQGGNGGNGISGGSGGQGSASTGTSQGGNGGSGLVGGGGGQGNGTTTGTRIGGNGGNGIGIDGTIYTGGAGQTNTGATGNGGGGAGIAGNGQSGAAGGGGGLGGGGAGSAPNAGGAGILYIFY